MIVARLIKKYQKDKRQCLVNEQGNIVTMYVSEKMKLENKVNDLLIGEFVWGEINIFGQFIALKRLSYEERKERERIHQKPHNERMNIYEDDIFLEFDFQV